MSNAALIITIWGAAIIAFIMITNPTKTSQVVSATQALISGPTKALQGR